MSKVRGQAPVVGEKPVTVVGAVPGRGKFEPGSYVPWTVWVLTEDGREVALPTTIPGSLSGVPPRKVMDLADRVNQAIMAGREVKGLPRLVVRVADSGIVVEEPSGHSH